MKKNILVSVDRSETRVAVLEAKGSPTEGKRRKKAAADQALAEKTAASDHHATTTASADVIVPTATAKPVSAPPPTGITNGAAAPAVNVTVNGHA